MAVLRRYLPDAGAALEVASGTGQHIAHLARSMPGVTWQPVGGRLAYGCGGGRDVVAMADRVR